VGVLEHPTPAWLLVPVQNCLWIPVKRAISDARHSIEIIVLKSEGSVEVWFRGPEQKAYVNGKEHGWFLRLMTSQKGPSGWTNSWHFP